MFAHNLSKLLSWGCFLWPAMAGVGFAGVPFDSAMVTRVENKVTVGEVKGQRVAARRPAAIADVIKAEDFLQTTSNARAELQFRDKSLIRIGENSVFSFHAASRTLTLDSGEMLFYVVPGKGGATIRTPTLTAAVTGTVALVRRNEIILFEGTLRLPAGNGKFVTIEAGGEFNAAKFVNGELVAYKVDISTLDLSLYLWAPLPDGAEKRIADANPGWIRRALGGDGGDGINGIGGLGLTGLSTPIFGGGAGTGINDVMTPVNPSGTVPMMEGTAGNGTAPLPSGMPIYQEMIPIPAK